MADKYTLNKDNSITVRLDEGTKELIAKAAKLEDRNMSNYVKHLIMVDLANKEEQLKNMK